MSKPSPARRSAPVTAAPGTPAPEGYTQRSATRAAGTYLAVVTPQEFLKGDHLAKLTRDLTRRFVRCAKFMRADDTSQDIALQVMEAARRWSADKGVPFGGYAWSCAERWMIGAMYRACIPVSGAETRAEVESIRGVSTETTANRSNDGETATVGDLLGTGRYTTEVEASRPDTTRESNALVEAVRAESAGYPEGVADLLLSVLHGVTPPDADLPGDLTHAGLVREAERFRTALAARLRREELVEAASVSLQLVETAPVPGTLPAMLSADADPFAGAWG